MIVTSIKAFLAGIKACWKHTSGHWYVWHDVPNDQLIILYSWFEETTEEEAEEVWPLIRELRAEYHQRVRFGKL